MNLRTKLSEWADKTFGGIHWNDFININQIGEQDKKGNEVIHITIEMVKEQAWKKDWISEETINRWEREVLEIVGKDNILKFEIKSSEANEGSCRGSIFLKSNGQYSSIKNRVFGYRFKLEIQKMILRDKKQK